MTVATRGVTDRRSLRFQSMDDILADVETLASGGEIRTTGNWSAGQIVGHVAILISGSLDGCPVRAPWVLRVAGRLFKSFALGRRMKPGIKLPARMSSMIPEPDYPLDDALEAMRKVIGRIAGGERMTQRSPLFGPMTHDDWVILHCRHAEMHFAFMHASTA